MAGGPATGPVLDVIGPCGGATVRADLREDRFCAAIRAAAAEADGTCETCGTNEAVALRDTGWWQTLCDACDAAPTRARKAR
ncbi:hypothetical protein GCM10007967_14610 [Xylanimonas ulmi]|uniref:Uncharacterized protein n=2 Tax=Xylanimonas ulmi TaxID=228973 RepID=A0A4Q7M6M0_9MICO|nr:hypothetical protein EV386_2584 [Xylanibacterium ulmi]